MTPDDFRRIALSMPQAAEAAHMGHPDFRVAGTVFATLGWPDGAWAMVKLTTDQQAMLVAAMPRIFQPVSGGWGRRGLAERRLENAGEEWCRNPNARGGERRQARQKGRGPARASRPCLRTCSRRGTCREAP